MAWHMVTPALLPSACTDLLRIRSLQHIHNTAVRACGGKLANWKNWKEWNASDDGGGHGGCDGGWVQAAWLVGGRGVTVMKVITAIATATAVLRMGMVIGCRPR